MENRKRNMFFLGLFAAAALILAGLNLSVVPAAIQETEEAILHPGSEYALYLETADSETMKLLWKETHLYGLWEDEEMEDFVQDVTKKFNAKIKRLQDLFGFAKEIGVDTPLKGTMIWQMIGQKLEETPASRVKYYVLLPDTSSFESLDKEPEKAIPHILAVMEFAPEKGESAKSAIKEILNLLAKTEKISTSEKTEIFKGLKATFSEITAQISDKITLRAGLFWRGASLYVAIMFNEDPMKVFSLLQEKEDPFIEKMRGRVEGEKRLSFCFVKTKPIMDLVKKLVEKEDKETFNQAMKLIGVDSLDSFLYGMAVDQKNIRETLFLGFPNGPEGIFRLLASKRIEKPLLVPMAQEAALTMYGSIGMEELGKFTEEMARHINLWKEEGQEGEEFEKWIEKIKSVLSGLDGRISFSLYSPELGSLMPRVALCAGLKDKESFSNLMDEVRESAKGILFKEQKHKEVPFTSVTIENNPMLSPAYAVLAGELILTESPASMKKLISDFLEQNEGEKEEGPPSPPAPEDEALPFWEMDYDVGRIFRLFYDKYFPMMNMALVSGLQMQSMFTGIRMEEFLLDASLLPLSDTFVKYMNKGEAGVYLTKEGIFMRSSSSLGNPMAATFGPAMGFVYGQYAGFGLDMSRGELEKGIVQEQLKIIRAALNTYRSAFGGGTKYPSSLGDLVGKGLIENAKIFLVPSDKSPDTIEYENEDGEITTLEVSFVYLPEKKLFFPEKRKFRLPEGMPEEIRARLEGKIPGRGEEEEEESPRTRAVLVYEARKNFHPGRLVLFHSGEIEEYGEEEFRELVSLKK